MLFREIIPISSQNYLKTMRTLCGQSAQNSNVKNPIGTYSYYCTLKSLRQ